MGWPGAFQPEQLYISGQYLQLLGSIHGEARPSPQSLPLCSQLYPDNSLHFHTEKQAVLLSPLYR